MSWNWTKGWRMQGKGSSWTMSVLISASIPKIALTRSLQMWARQEMDSG